MQPSSTHRRKPALYLKRDIWDIAGRSGIYCLLLGAYGEEGDGLGKDSRNGLAATAGGRLQ